MSSLALVVEGSTACDPPPPCPPLPVEPPAAPLPPPPPPPPVPDDALVVLAPPAPPVPSCPPPHAAAERATRIGSAKRDLSMGRAYPAPLADGEIHESTCGWSLAGARARHRGGLGVLLDAHHRSVHERRGRLGRLGIR